MCIINKPQTSSNKNKTSIYKQKRVTNQSVPNCRKLSSTLFNFNTAVRNNSTTKKSHANNFQVFLKPSKEYTGFLSNLKTSKY